MTTSKQQAAINIAKQIDKLRLWAAGRDPQVALMINQAIATELGNQASGIAPSQMIRKTSAGFGDVSDFLSSITEVDPSTLTLDPTTDLNITPGNLDIPSTSGFDLSSLSSVFTGAGSGAAPALASTAIASNPQSVSGVLNSISNTVSAAIRDIYAPQVTLAQAKSQLALIQTQAQAAQLGIGQQLAQQQTLTKLLPIALIGALGIFALKAFNTNRTETFQHKRRD